MVMYTYPQRNLFETPEYYHYANCRQDGYLNAWMDSRAEFIDVLVANREQVESEAHSAGQPGTLEGELALVLSEYHETGNFSEADHELLGRLVHKYEVSRRFYQRYSDDWRRINGAPEAGLLTYLLFAEALSAYCQNHSNELQKLSTLIKLCDALVSLGPRAYSRSQSLKLEAILVGERSLVLDVQRNANDS